MDPLYQWNWLNANFVQSPPIAPRLRQRKSQCVLNCLYRSQGPVPSDTSSVHQLWLHLLETISSFPKIPFKSLCSWYAGLVAAFSQAHQTHSVSWNNTPADNMLYFNLAQISSYQWDPPWPPSPSGSMVHWLIWLFGLIAVEFVKVLLKSVIWPLSVYSAFPKTLMFLAKVTDFSIRTGKRESALCRCVFH